MRNIHLIDNQIYITSDEKPKRDDWAVYRDNQVYKCVEDIVGDEFKKVILSNDKWLIKFGVPAIDAEFVDWFFDNPNCEYVEVTNEKIMIGWEPDYSYEDIGISGSKEVYQDFYKISIPKDEHKQSYEYVGECKGNNNNGCFLDSCGHDCGCFVRKPKQETTLEESKQEFPKLGTKEFNDLASVYFGGKPKQETLEQAARKYSENRETKLEENLSFIDFINGAKWQQEQDKNKYSEKEVELIALEMVSWTLDNIGNKNAISSVKFDEIISKFKKK